MYCLAMLQSGNYVYSLCRYFERKNLVFEVVNTPCHLAKWGCSYALKFPERYTDEIIKGGHDNGTPVMEIYKVNPGIVKNFYQKIFPNTLN